MSRSLNLSCMSSLYSWLNSAKDIKHKIDLQTSLNISRNISSFVTSCYRNKQVWICKLLVVKEIIEVERVKGIGPSAQSKLQWLIFWNTPNPTASPFSQWISHSFSELMHWFNDWCCECFCFLGELGRSVGFEVMISWTSLNENDGVGLPSRFIIPLWLQTASIVSIDCLDCSLSCLLGALWALYAHRLHSQFPWIQSLTIRPVEW